MGRQSASLSHTETVRNVQRLHFRKILLALEKELGSGGIRLTIQAGVKARRGQDDTEEMKPPDSVTSETRRVKKWGVNFTPGILWRSWMVRLPLSVLGMLPSGEGWKTDSE